MISIPERMNQSSRYRHFKQESVDLLKVQGFAKALHSFFAMGMSGGPAVRHAYSQLQQTVVYGTTGEIRVSRGNYNLLQMQLAGTVVAVAGADANHGIMQAVSQFTFKSDKQGQIGQFTGVELYYLGLTFGVTPPIVNSGADGGLSSCSWWFPVWVDSQDVLTVGVEWAALAMFHSTATAYDGVLTVVPDYIPDMPTGELRYKRKTLGPGGVVAAGTTLTENPTVVKGFRLMMFMCLMTITAKATLNDAFATYLLEHNHGVPIGNPLNATHIRDIDAREIGAAHTVGVDFCRFAPINNDQSSVLAITNGAVATVDYTRIIYVYISHNVVHHVYNKGSDGITKNWGVAPDFELTTEGNAASEVAPRERVYVVDGKFGDRWNVRPREKPDYVDEFHRFWK